MKSMRPAPPAVIVLALVALGVLLRLAQSLPPVRAASDTISFFAFLWVFFWLGWLWRDRKCGMCWRPGSALRFSATQYTYACHKHRDELRDWWEDQQRQSAASRETREGATSRWIVIRGNEELGYEESDA